MSGDAGDRPVRLGFVLDRPAVARALILAVVGLGAASLAGVVSTRVFGDGHLHGFVPLFDLDREMNVPTWFSSALFLLAAVLLWKAGDLSGAVSPARRRPLWRGLALLFVLLSLDEVAAVHEMAVDPLRRLFHAGGVLYFSWVIAGAALAALVVLACGRLVLSLPSQVRARVIAAAVLFLAGALGMEMLAGRLVEQGGGAGLAYALMANLEEVLELSGQVVFIDGLLRLLAG